MYQVAYGGYILDDTTQFYDSPNTYYEPGFNLLFPKTFALPKLDTVYFIIRKRTNSAGTTFGTSEVADATIAVKDTTTGEDVPATLSDNTINAAGWFYDVAVITVTLKQDDGTEVRNLEVLYSDNTLNRFIVFRATFDDAARTLNTLVVRGDEVERRPTASSADNSLDIELTDTNVYTLISPLAFEESEDAEGAFSHPFQRIHYDQTQTYNLEDLAFEIGNLSHVALNNVVRVQKLADNIGTGVLIIDAYAVKTLREVGDEFTFDVTVTSPSGNVDTLSVRLYRRNRLFLTD